MTIKELCVLFLSVLVSVLGQFFLKLGAVKIGKIGLNNEVNKIFEVVTTPEIILGLLFYGLGAFLYIALLTRVDLSVLSPATSLVYVFSVLIGCFVFKETLSPSRLAGIGFIVCGVILVISKK